MIQYLYSAEKHCQLPQMSLLPDRLGWCWCAAVGEASAVGKEARVTVKKSAAALFTLTLQGSDGQEDIHLQPHGSASCALVGALARLVAQERLAVTGTCMAGDGAGHLLLALHVAFPLDIWTGRHRWRAGAPAVALFNALQPLPAPTTGSSAATLQQQQLADMVGSAEREGSSPSQAARFSLAEVFASLPSCSTSLQLPAMQPAGSASSTGLHLLPAEVLDAVCAHLPCTDLAALAATCRTLRAVAAEAAPGLRCKLFKHQRAALRWMAARESHTVAARCLPHPYIRTFISAGGLPLYLDASSGEVSMELPPPVHDLRGGFFCDEPGLGKTVTALGLILRSAGCLAQPPAGANVRWSKDSAGRKVGLYTAGLAAGELVASVADPAAGAGAGSPGYSYSPGCSSPGSGRATRSSRLLASQQAPVLLPPALPVCASPEQLRTPTKRKVLPEARTDARVATAPATEPASSCEQAVPAGGTSSEAQDSYVTETWVQCESCFTWKLLPPGALPNQPQPTGQGGAAPGSSDDAPWFCYMHPHPDQATCSSVPADPHAEAGSADEEGCVTQFPGYVPAAEGQATCLPQHVDQFEQLLAAHRQLWSPPGSGRHRRAACCALDVLLGLPSPDLLLTSGLRIPADLAQPEGYGQLFTLLGLRPADNGAASSPAAGRKRRGSGLSSPAGKRCVWVQPQRMSGLRLDLPALAAARDRLLTQPAAPPGASWLAPATAGHAIYLSRATLVVVPNPMLLEHWTEQVDKMVAGGRLVVRRVDERWQGSVADLAWCSDLVLTTFSRLSAEVTAAEKKGAASPLLQVHWLRLIIDEGHMLGASLGVTNKLSMACALRADRRWVMTGTPTPATPGSNLSHLQPLLAILRQQPYSSNRKAWTAAVQEPCEAKDGPRLEGLTRLRCLLSTLLIRAAKSDLDLLPPCSVTVTVLDAQPSHAASYNALVEVIRRNLLTSDWLDEDHCESLLAGRNGRWAKEMLANLRLSCCVAGAIELEAKEEDIEECMRLLAGRLGLEPGPPQPPPRPLPAAPLPPKPAAATTAGDDAPQHLGADDGAGAAGSDASGDAAGVGEAGRSSSGRQEEEQALMEAAGLRYVDCQHPLAHVEHALRWGGLCQCCGASTRQPMVAPGCCHLLCLDCCATSRERCPLPACGCAYVMQPVDAPERLRHNPKPKWPVPEELIEWQPVYHQRGAQGLSGGAWQPNWQATESTKVAHLLRRLRQVGAAPPAGSQAWPCRTKAIVFTLFWQHMQLIQSSLEAAGVRLMLLRSGLKGREKPDVVADFAAEPGAAVLLMDESGAVGLDLSFVSYVFLMEPLSDASLQQQVISRAHRMGAKGPVAVELLVMRNTLEEELLALVRRTAVPVGMAGAPPAMPDGGSAEAAAGSAEAAEAASGAATTGGLEHNQQARNHLFRRLHKVAVAATDAQAVPDLLPSTTASHAGDMEDAMQWHRRADSSWDGQQGSSSEAVADHAAVSQLSQQSGEPELPAQTLLPVERNKRVRFSLPDLHS